MFSNSAGSSVSKQLVLPSPWNYVNLCNGLISHWDPNHQEYVTILILIDIGVSFKEPTKLL